MGRVHVSGGPGLRGSRRTQREQDNGRTVCVAVDPRGVIVLLTLVIYSVGNFLAGVIWSFAMAIPNGLGSVVIHVGERRDSEVVKQTGIFLCEVSMSYVALMFTGAIVGSVRSLLRDANAGFGWAILYWPAAFLLCAVPTTCGLKSVLYDRSHDGPMLRRMATTAFMLNGVGFFLFAFAPSLMYVAWGWVPFVVPR